MIVKEFSSHSTMQCQHKGKGSEELSIVFQGEGAITIGYHKVDQTKIGSPSTLCYITMKRV